MLPIIVKALLQGWKDFFWIGCIESQTINFEQDVINSNQGLVLQVNLSKTHCEFFTTNVRLRF